MQMLRPVLWLWLIWPLAFLAWAAVTDQLGANPQEALLRHLGELPLALLLIIVAVPGIARLGLADLRVHRRLLGLWAYGYATLHLLAFWAFEHDFRLLPLVQNSVVRPFVTIGLLVWLLLVPLALTSNRWSMRRLGPAWKRLHLLVWPAIVLGLLHFVLHKAGKNDYTEPLIYALVFAALVAARLAWRRPVRPVSPAR